MIAQALLELRFCFSYSNKGIGGIILLLLSLLLYYYYYNIIIIKIIIIIIIIIKCYFIFKMVSNTVFMWKEFIQSWPEAFNKLNLITICCWSNVRTYYSIRISCIK